MSAIRGGTGWTGGRRDGRCGGASEADAAAAVEAVAATPGFDLAATILEDAGPGAYCRVARAFCEDFRPQLEALDRDGGVPRGERARHFAHQLKSAAANVGAIELRALALAVEAELERGGAPDLTALADACRDAVAVLDRAVP